MKVSIVIPVFNGGTCIGRALESVRRQSFRDWECVVVNDASTDNTSDIIEEFCIKDARIKLITGDGNGVTAARIKGVDESDGNYLFFMDADDTVPPAALEVLVDYAVSDGSDIVIGNINHIDGAFRYVALYGSDSIKTGEDLFNWIVDNRTGFLWGKLIRRALFGRILVQPLGVKLCEDYIQMLQITALAETVSYCGQSTYDYYQTPDSACNKILTKDEYADRFYVICSYLSRIICSSIFSENQKIRLKALFLYYARLFLLVNGKWGRDKEDLKFEFKKYLNDREVAGDTLLTQSHRGLIIKAMGYFLFPFSLAYVAILRYIHHRIR